MWARSQMLRAVATESPSPSVPLKMISAHLVYIVQKQENLETKMVATTTTRVALRRVTPNELSQVADRPSR